MSEPQPTPQKHLVTCRSSTHKDPVIWEAEVGEKTLCPSCGLLYIILECYSPKHSEPYVWAYRPTKTSCPRCGNPVYVTENKTEPAVISVEEKRNEL